MKLASMRKFTERYKLTAHSLWEIREGVKAAAKRLADKDVKCDGHVVAQANVVNVATLYLLKHSQAEQDQIIIDLIPELEQHKESATPLPIAPLIAPAVGRKRAFAAGHRVIENDGEGQNRIAGDVSLPKRRG